MAELTRYVHAAGRVWPPGSTPPSEVAAMIQNPKAWGREPSVAPRYVPRTAAPSARQEEPEEVEEVEEVEEEGPEEESDAADGQGDEQDSDGQDDEGGEEDDLDAPARPAKTAPVAEWREYILATVDIDEDTVKRMSKAELIDADERAEHE